jgi:hypothetical protein
MPQFRRKSSPLTEASQATQKGFTTEGKVFSAGDWLVKSLAGGTTVVPDSVFNMIYEEIPEKTVWELADEVQLMADYGHQLVIEPEIRCLICNFTAKRWLEIDSSVDVRVPCKEPQE